VGLDRVRAPPSIGWLPTEEKEIRLLSEAEEAQVLLAAPPRLQPLITVALQTGLRKMELVTLTWPQVDWERQEVVVISGRAKNRRMRRVPMTETVRDLLAQLAQGPTDRDNRVFGYRSLTASFERAVARSGLAGVSPHALRHTFATRALERGVDIRTVQRWLGPQSLRQTERYLHPSNANEREAMRVLDGPPRGRLEFSSGASSR